MDTGARATTNHGTWRGAGCRRRRRTSPRRQMMIVSRGGRDTWRSPTTAREKHPRRSARSARRACTRARRSARRAASASALQRPAAPTPSEARHAPVAAKPAASASASAAVHGCDGVLLRLAPVPAVYAAPNLRPRRTGDNDLGADSPIHSLHKLQRGGA